MVVKSANKNILLVGEKFVPEDNLHLALKRQGHAVTCVLDGWQAMTLVDELKEKEYFHLVVIGYPTKSMPEIEVLSLLRSKFPKNKLPVICILPKGELEMLEMLKDMEATLVLEFPRSLTLIKAIEEILV